MKKSSASVTFLLLLVSLQQVQVVHSQLDFTDGMEPPVRCTTLICLLLTQYCLSLEPEIRPLFCFEFLGEMQSAPLGLGFLQYIRGITGEKQRRDMQNIRRALTA